MSDALSVNDFFAKASKLGFTRLYNFKVLSIDGFPAVNLDPKDYMLYVEAASIPTRQVKTATVPYKAFEFSVPTVVTYPDNNTWKISFFSDNKQLIRSLFENWQTALYDPNTYSTSNVDFGKGSVTLQLIDDQGKQAKQYILKGAYPTQINTVNYAVTDSGQTVAKVPVTFTYQYFETL